jgi:ABC-2 type transport system ATP-binding protein
VLVAIGVVLVVLAMVLGRWSDGSSERSQGLAAEYPPPACRRAVRPARADPGAGASTDQTLRSFDGTGIRLHWMPTPRATADAPAPTVVMGAGWGLPGATRSVQVDTQALAALDLGALADAGYNVLTWDPRGFGASGGTADFDSAAVDGADVAVLIDWLAGQAGVQLDRAGDPRMAMAGASYGGAIGLVTASIDCRVDALVPMFTWSSLSEALFPSGTPRLPWLEVLSDVAPGSSADPHLRHAREVAASHGVVDPADLAWFRARDLARALGTVRVPTLFIQGTVDPLVGLDEAITSYQVLHAAGVPTAMIWTCGGHGVCLTAPSDVVRLRPRVLAWLDRFVKGDRSAVVGPKLEYVDQHGRVHDSDRYPVPEAAPLEGRGAGRLELRAGGGAGPIDRARLEGHAGLNAAIRAMPAPAGRAVTARVDVAGREGMIVGRPRLEIAYRGTVADGERPTRLFAQLVDVATGLVIGGQITPVPVILDGSPKVTSIALPTTVFAFRPDATIELQIVAVTSAFAPPRLGGAVDIEQVGVRLPVASDVAAQGR